MPRTVNSAVPTHGRGAESLTRELPRCTVKYDSIWPGRGQCEHKETSMLDWREVDLGGATIEGLTNVCHYGRGILAWGRRGGHPYAARLSSTGNVDETLPRWSGRVSSVLQ